MNLEKTYVKKKGLKKLVDCPNAREIFPGVDIAGGVCYFLYERNYEGDCLFRSYENGVYSDEVLRKMDEYKVFIRSIKGLSIIKKSLAKDGRITIEQTASPQKPFGLPTNYPPKASGIPCWFTQKKGKQFADRRDIDDSGNIINKWKLLLPKAPIAGQTDFTKPVGFYYEGNVRVAEPGCCCTESWIVGGAFDTEEEVINFKSYILTKIVRFLLLQTVVSQDVLRNKFCFVPSLNKYDRIYTDEYLRERWNITDEEWKYIDSRIHNYEH